MKKRILCLALALCMVLSMAPTSVGATEGPHISAGSASVSPGSSVSIAITATALENLASLDVSVYYDPTYLSVSSTTNGGLLSGCQTSVNTSESGEVKLSLLSLDGISGSGTLLTVRFTVSSSCPAGEYPISVAVGDAYSSELQPVSIGAVSGKLTVTKPAASVTTFSLSCNASVSALQVGQQVTFTVKGSSSRPFASADFKFEYDPEHFELVSVSLNSALANSGAIYDINTSTPGSVRISYVSLNSVSSTNLYTVTLKVIADVSATSTVTASAGNVYKENLESYAPYTVSRSVTLQKQAVAPDYPDMYMNMPLMVVGRESTSTLTLEQGAGVAAGDFVLTYDTALLRCVSVTANDAVAETGGMVVINDNYTEGTIRFSYINVSGYSDTEIPVLDIVWVPRATSTEHYFVTIGGSGVVDAKFNSLTLEYYPDNGCIYDPVVTVAGCMNGGYTTYICSCGDSFVDDYVDALGHAFVGGECSRCGISENPVAEGTCGDGSTMYWNLSEDGHLIIFGEGWMMDYSAENPAPWAEYAADITELTIGAGIVYIGSYAFGGCTALEKVTFEGSAPTISADSFSGVAASAYYPTINSTWTESVMQGYGGSLSWFGYGSGSCGEGVTWSFEKDTLTVSGSGAMENYDLANLPPWYAAREEIKYVIIEDGVTGIGDYAFYYIQMTDAEIPESVTRIGEGAFYNCHWLQRVYIPSGLTELGKNAFYCACAVNVFTIPETLTDISSAFASCMDSLWVVYFKGDAPVFDENTFLWDYCTAYYPEWNETWTEDVLQDYGGTITWVPYDEDYFCDDLSWDLDENGVLTLSGNGAMYEYCYNDTPWYDYKDQITKVVIEEGITRLCNQAFYNCVNLTEVILPESLQDLGSSSFNNCDALTEVTIPSNVSGGSYSFAYCDNLTDVTLSDGISAVPNGMFCGCKALTGITIPDSVTSIGYNAFYNCSAMKTVEIPEGVTSIGTSAFGYCTSLEGVVIPDSVTAVSNYTFNNCSALKDVVIGDGVTSIGGSAFQNCVALTSVDIPGSVTSIGNYGFYNCSGLQTATFHTGLETIGDRAFQGCTSLTGIVLPEGLKTIGRFSFKTCSSAQVLTLPSTLTAIGDETFHGCSSLTEVVIPESLTSIGNYMFSQCTGLQRIEIPDTVTYIGISAFHTCVSLKEVELPEGLTSISNYTFSGCTGLESVVIPAGVTSMGVSVFYNATSLERVVFEGNAPQIGSNVFYNATPTAYYPVGDETWTDSVKQNYGGSVTWEIHCNGNHYVNQVVSENISDSLTQTNDSTYPFAESDGWYSSTNKGNSTTSTYTIQALADCTLVLKYTVSSEVNYDSLYIVKNSANLLITSGIYSSASEMTIKLSAGDYLYIRYKKDGSASAGTDSACFKIESCVQTALTFTEEIEPTCTDAVICDSCHETVKAALGHSFSDWVCDAEPDCENDGARWRQCSVCGHSESEILAALGHSYGKWYTTTEATCTTDGEKRHDCESCDHYETEVIEATGHSYVSAVTAPTCTEQGYTTHTCSVCSDSYVDSYVDATGHSYGEWYTTVEATCTADGEKRHDCESCDHYETEVIEAIGHSYVSVVTAPTCTEQGYTTHTCSACGDSYVDAYVSATGHSWSAWTVTKKATYLEDGEEQRSCASCGETETRVVKFTNPFTDVPSSKYFYEPVMWAVENGVTSGKTTTTFGVGETCTREQIVTFLWRAMGKPEPTTTVSPFTDVQYSGSYYYKAVLWAVETGITSGRTATYFGVNTECTRAQIVTFLWRAMGKPEPETAASPFADVQNSRAYYYKAVLWAVEQGITSGVNPTYFGVDEACTREQAVTFLFRALGDE